MEFNHYSQTQVSFLDFFIGGLLLYGCFRGIWNGFFVELASFVSLLIGIFIAIKFSFLMQTFLNGHVSWNPKTIQITAFILTFVLAVIGITFLAKFFTTLANFTGLGCFNKLLGGFFGTLKMILIVSVLINYLQKVNSNYALIDKKTIDNSIFYHPIQKSAGFIYPSISEWFKD
ncbi:MAG TPA: CvpA family protein [Flavobacterium sp.]|nr:CvpA family protein [Flavobacterium sp.]